MQSHHGSESSADGSQGGTAIRIRCELLIRGQIAWLSESSYEYDRKRPASRPSLRRASPGLDSGRSLSCESNRQKAKLCGHTGSGKEITREKTEEIS
jgi:hypothetical protein